MTSLLMALLAPTASAESQSTPTAHEMAKAPGVHVVSHAPVVRTVAQADPSEDPVGSPSRYTVATADDVLIRKVEGAGINATVSSRWATTTAALDGLASSGAYSSPVGTNVVNRLTRQATGRFLDPSHQEVLSLSMSGTSLQVLAGVNGQAEGGPAVVPTWSQALPVQSVDSPFGLAAGDLDRAVGSDKAYHDEAVVVNVTATHQLSVQVVDYEQHAGQVTVTSASGAMPSVGSSGHGSISVEVGDFNGDGKNEIAAVWQNPTGGFGVTFLNYSTDSGTPTVSVVHTIPDLALTRPADTTPQFVAGYADTAAGDFDGTGRESLAIAFARGQTTGKAAPYLGVFGFDGSDALRSSGVTVSVDFSGTAAVLGAPTNGTWTQRGLQLESGLFRYDGSGFSISRRQLALAYPGFATLLGGSVQVQVFDVALPAASCSPCTYSVTPQTSVLNAVGPGNVQLPYSMTTGGFAGVARDDLPVWGIAVGASGTKQSAVSYMRVPPSGNMTVAFTSDVAAAGTQYIVTAYDRTGRSLQLGAPVRFTIDALKSTTLIAEEPPKHADWLDGGFLNISRKPEYAITLGSGSDQSFSAKTTTQSDQEVGFSQETDVSNTVKAGLFGLPGAGLNVGLKNKLAASYKEKADQTNSSSTKVALEVKSTSNDDDIIGAYYQTIYVYRYPILGLQEKDATAAPVPGCTATCAGFWEIQIPGNTTTLSGNSSAEPGVPGKSLYWYQPTHQNGNALSYPNLNGNQVAIPDLGSYSYTDDSGSTVTKSQPLFNIATTLGGVDNEFNLKIDKSVGGGFQRSSERKLKENLDATVGLTAHWVLPPVAKGEADLTTSYGFDDNKSWSNITTGDTETTSSSAFSLHVPQFTDTFSYKIGTAYYTDSTGTQRIREAADLTSSASGSSWWNSTYGQKPDPGFNLPYGSVMTKNGLGIFDDPKWNPVPDRQRIRGFYALKPPAVGQPADSGAPYTQNPREGDPVTFAVQVHNFSLDDLTSQVAVQFYAVPVDARQVNVTGPAVSMGAPQQIASIPARGYVTVLQPWKATRPAGVVGDQNYRIFAVIDPTNQVDEIHELNDDKGACPTADVLLGKPLVDPMTGATETLACGTNNQGYGQLTVSPAALGGPQQPGIATLNNRSLQVQAADGTIQDGTRGPVKIAAATPVTGFVRVLSDVDDVAFHDVAIFDGAPTQGHLIASVQVAGVSGQRGSTASFTWTPSSTGRHKLYAVLLGVRQPGSVRTDTLAVDDVTPARTGHVSLAHLPDVLRGIDMPESLRRRMLRYAHSAIQNNHAHRPRAALQDLYSLRSLERKRSGIDVTQADGAALDKVVTRTIRQIRKGMGHS